MLIALGTNLVKCRCLVVETYEGFVVLLKCGMSPMPLPPTSTALRSAGHLENVQPGAAAD